MVRQQFAELGLTCISPLQCGTVGEHGVILPPPLPLTSERLERHGLYLIEDGQTIFLWVGRDAVPQLIIDVFNLPNYEVLRGGKVSAFDSICSKQAFNYQFTDDVTVA